MKLFSANKDSKRDQELINLVRKHADQSAFSVLYQRYSGLIYAVCLKYLGEREWSRDVAMDLYELIFEKLKVNEVNDFRSWTYVVTKNHCLMQLRTTKKREETHIQLMESEDNLHLLEEEQFDKGNKLEDCMTKLAEKQRNCVRSFFMEELSYKQISERMQIDLKKVKSYIQNGKRNLRFCMEDK